MGWYGMLGRELEGKNKKGWERGGERERLRRVN